MRGGDSTAIAKADMQVQLIMGKANGKNPQRESFK